MRNKNDIIYPEKVSLVGLALCCLISGILALMEDAERYFVMVPPHILFGVSLLELISKCKTVEFSCSAITVKHMIFNRSIQWEKVKGIEITRQRHKYFIFICLGNCPLWCETRLDVGLYILLHPVCLIPIEIAEDRFDKYKDMVKKYYSNVYVTGDSSSSPG